MQLNRASFSIPLNLAEGAGEYSPTAKANFYRIARRSTTECMSILDVMAQIEQDATRYKDVIDELRIVAAGLTGLAVAQERRAQEK